MALAPRLGAGLQCIGLGYRAIKLHSWDDARRDAQLAQALRRHVGDGVELMYDGSAGFEFTGPTGGAGVLCRARPNRVSGHNAPVGAQGVVVSGRRRR